MVSKQNGVPANVDFTGFFKSMAVLLRISDPPYEWNKIIENKILKL